MKTPLRMGATGATSRVRLALEGSGSLALAGGVLSPTLQAGLRCDGGDAETGAGLEVAGGLAYATGSLKAALNARALVVHEDSEDEEWGFAASVVYEPSTDGRGLSMNLGSTWDVAENRVQSLWARPDASGFVPGGAAMRAPPRLLAQLGYGVAGRYGRARGPETDGRRAPAIRARVRVRPAEDARGSAHEQPQRTESGARRPYRRGRSHRRRTGPVTRRARDGAADRSLRLNGAVRL